ncbi:hypothetical protein [Microbispora siamensis]|uniref:Phosphopantetheine adenylyltransferase n=1 Tax=Microbispora siamensis TaxID=564413 RepID=A0ABQ4GDE2_9ACTN|nr:hypothetical protein [Microbispora siamensis]GIH59448.1 hypothetical protein Msi02_02650 [Microbispora siamensis]
MALTIERTVRGVLVILGVVTALPALALVAPGRALDFSYGISPPSDPMALALLQHRGILQGALGAALVWAAFHPAVRVPAAVTAIVTKSVFLGLMAALPVAVRAGATPGILFDIGAIVLLAAVLTLHRRLTGSHGQGGGSPARLSTDGRGRSAAGR